MHDIVYSYAYTCNIIFNNIYFVLAKNIFFVIFWLMHLCIIISLTEFNNQLCSNSFYHVIIYFLHQSSSEKARSSADSVWLSSLTVNTSSAVSLSNNLHLWPIRVV